MGKIEVHETGTAFGLPLPRVIPQDDGPRVKVLAEIFRDIGQPDAGLTEVVEDVFARVMARIVRAERPRHALLWHRQASGDAKGGGKASAAAAERAVPMVLECLRHGDARRGEISRVTGIGDRGLDRVIAKSIDHRWIAAIGPREVRRYALTSIGHTALAEMRAAAREAAQ